jgi:formylglycine-generating enzyme required for sulfatase activity
MSLAVCPPPADLERLFLGGLPEADEEAIEQHVQACRSCGAKLAQLLAAKDTLAGLLRRDTERDDSSGSSLVSDLAIRIKRLRSSFASPVQQGAPMLTISCPGCRKALSVKAEYAGKKVRCPGCARVMVVPARVAAPVSGEARQTVPPAPGRAPAPIPTGLGEPPTHPSSISSDLTDGKEASDAEDAASLTEFLAPPQAADELGRLGGYRILEILGHGGMGVVFLGEDTTLGRKVAIKALLPRLAQNKASQQRFLREARAAAALEHDHVVAIHHVGEDRGAPYIVMPFLRGESLDQRLKREERLPLADVLRIGREAAEGLAAAHAMGLIHIDIKPANLWLEAPRSRVKILDFGLARAAAQESRLTQVGSIVGTPAYMAPEQGRGEALDARCDLFSLGVVLYRMCTGEQPFHGSDPLSTLMSVAMYEPPPPIELNAGIPRELSELVMRLLEKDPAKRIASAGDVIAVLERLEDDLKRQQAAQEKTEAVRPAPPSDATAPMKQDSGKPTSAPVTAPRRRRRAPLVAAAILLGLLGSGALAGIAYHWRTNKDIVRVESNDPTNEGADPAKEDGTPPVIENGIGMKLVFIPAGKFRMGSPQEEIDRCLKLAGEGWMERASLKSEGPEHEVEITQPFYMASTEVTVGQFRRFVEDKKYEGVDARWQRLGGYEQTDEHPATWVTWQNALDFCAWLSAKEGKTYRLPTEAEWEYCCRAGKSGTRYCFGNEDEKLSEYAWYMANSGGHPHPVGKLAPNDWGLYDMHGNVYEWCLDGYDMEYYQTSPRQDPQGKQGGLPVYRGGVCFLRPWECRCAYRWRVDPPWSPGLFIGIRVVCEVPGKKVPSKVEESPGGPTRRPGRRRLSP